MDTGIGGTGKVTSQQMERLRMGEIAIALVKYLLGQEGLKLNASFRRKLGYVAKETCISKEELVLFSEQIIQELLEEHVRTKPQEME
jgi:hypothetical protein